MEQERSERRIKDSLKIISEIGNFCFERKDNDPSRALQFVSSNFESSQALFQLMLEKHDTLQVTFPDGSNNVSTHEHIAYLILDQSRFTFVATMSILEFTAKNIGLKQGSSIKSFLEENRKKPRYYLGDIIYASKELGLISSDEKQEWDFFISIRNALVHNNTIPDEDLEHVVYNESFSFKNGVEMKGNIRGLFLFSKKVVELFYDWAAKEVEKASPLNIAE
jgi:hypothetical protein